MSEAPHVESLEALNDSLGVLGGAWRGDWSDFDGRTLRAQLEDFTTLSALAIAGANVVPEAKSLPATWGACAACRCWAEYCSCGAGNQS